MSEQITFLTDDYAHLGSHETVVALAEPIEVPAAQPRPIEEGGSSSAVAFWGKENTFPQDVIEEAEKDTELPAILDWKGRVLQGREVVALNKVWDEEKQDFKIVRVNDEEINQFLSDIIFKRYWREACIDFTWFQNIFPDLIKSKGDKIVYLGTHDASFCRWGVMDGKGNVTKCFVSAQWKDGAKPGDSEKVMEHKVVDPYNPEVVEALRKAKATKRFVYPVNYPSPGKSYYPSAAWTSFLFSPWFTIKKNIPVWKNKLMTRVLSAKFIITIPINYWPAAHKDWATKTADEQKIIKKAKVKEINDKLTGMEGVGSSILSEVGFDENGKELPAFKIIPIESGFKDGEHLEDSQEASGHLNRSNNVDSTLVGSGPGRSKDAGSGSDKRVAFNIYTATLQPYREVIMEPLYFIAKYNGWLDRFPYLHFKVLEVDLQTLDQGNTSVEKSPVTTPAKTVE